MARPDIQGSVIDTGDGAGGGKNGAQDAEFTENNDALDGPGDNPDDIGGGENPQDGAELGGEENPAGGEEPGAEPKHDAPIISDELRAQLRSEITAELRKEMSELKPPAPRVEAPKEPSEEEWVKHEAEWGTNRNAIKATVSRITRAVEHVMKQVDQRFAKFEKADALRTLGQDKDFTDAARYTKDIEEFLADYNERDHSNPNLLKKAVIYARGKNAKSNITRVAAGQERNRRIAGVARPAGAAGPTGKNGAPARPLTPIERSAARAAGMSDADYIKSKNARRVLA